MCQLLRVFPGWEAIKTTRGHYRSCGKDPHSCCVNHLLRDQPVIRSGREETYAPGKDTGRYWEAGAANVHWVIATEEQVGQGIQNALTRVRSGGVFIEGNTFSEYVDVDLMIMVARAGSAPIKKSARLALAKSSAIYLTGETDLQAGSDVRGHFLKWLRSAKITHSDSALPLYGRENMRDLVALVERVGSLAAA